MGKTEKETESNSFLDIFEMDHSKFNDAGAVEEVEQEVVTEGHGGAEDVTKETEDDENDDKGVAEEEDDSSEEKGVGKQAANEEDDEESSSEEDAPTNDGSNDDSEVTPVQELMETLASEGSLEFEEDAEYEPTPEGLRSLIDQTVEKRSQKAVDEFKGSLPEQAGKLLEVLEKGGSIEDFQAITQGVDFSKVDVSNERNQGYLVEDWMKQQGFDDLEIRERLDDLKSAGLLEKEAKIAQKKLHESQVKTNEERVKQLEIQQKQQEEEAEKDAIEFKEKVTGLKEIKGFSLTPKKAQKLYDFITKPGEDGKTEFEKMDSEENRLLYAMLAMDGFDKSKLSKQEASRQTIKLKKTLGNYQDKNTSPKGGNVRKNNTKESNGIDIPWSF